MVTGRIWRLTTVVCFHHESSLKGPVFGLEDVGVPFKMTALKGIKSLLEGAKTS